MPMPRVLGWSYGGARFLMSEVPLQCPLVAPVVGCFLMSDAPLYLAHKKSGSGENVRPLFLTY